MKETSMTDEQVLEQALQILRTTRYERCGVLWSEHARVLLAEVERLEAENATLQADARLGAAVRRGLSSRGDVVRLERRAVNRYRATVFSDRFIAPVDDSDATPEDALEAALAQPAAALGEGTPC